MIFEALLSKKVIFCIMALLAVWVGCAPSTSFALPVASYEQGPNHITDREAIDSFLAQELVSKKLSEMGLSKTEIEVRLDRLSEEQVHALAARLERIKSGGAGWAIGLVAVILLVGIVLFLLTHTVHIEPKESIAK